MLIPMQVQGCNATTLIKLKTRPTPMQNAGTGSCLIIIVTVPHACYLSLSSLALLLPVSTL
jgi:hypothetical protein